MAEEKDAEPYAIMECRDEAQILAELQGKYLDEFVYSFKVGNRKVVGLSWAGVKEIAYRMGGIRVEDVQIQDKGDFWMVTAKAVDAQRNASRFGVSTQAKVLKTRQGPQEDQFALQKAVSKAQRNAIRALIPEGFIKLNIDRFLSGGGPEAPGREPPKRVESEQAEVGVPGALRGADYYVGVLEQAGLDSGLVDIRAGADAVTVKPVKFLGDLWGPVNDALRGVGCVWVSEGRESRWRCPA